MTAEPDYKHSYHAGNVGDVWKHCALVSLLDALREEGGLRVVDTHAGEGFYRFQSTGEWTAGIGKLWEGGFTGVTAVDRYVERVARLTSGDRRAYPGSPALIIDALRAGDAGTFCEARPEAAAALRRNVGGRPGVQIVEGDGYQALAAISGPDLFVHIDPPYVERDEWTQAAQAVVDVARRAPDARVMLWYPIKALTRPNQMLNLVRAAGVPAVSVELVVTPLELKRKALAGSGLLLVNAPPSVLADVHAAASVLGPRCATHDGRWFVRTTAWGRAG